MPRRRWILHRSPSILTLLRFFAQGKRKRCPSLLLAKPHLQSLISQSLINSLRTRNCITGLRKPTRIPTTVATTKSPTQEEVTTQTQGTKLLSTLPRLKDHLNTIHQKSQSIPLPIQISSLMQPPAKTAWKKKRFTGNFFRRESRPFCSVSQPSCSCSLS